MSAPAVNVTSSKQRFFYLRILQWSSTGQPVDFSKYQNEALKTDLLPLRDEKGLLIALLGLAGESGELLSEYKKFLRDGPSHELFPQRVAEELGDVLWYVASIARRFGLALDEIAELNLQKCQAHWVLPDPASEVFSVHKRFDAAYPPKEQFPSQLVAKFLEKKDGNSAVVTVMVGDTQMGQELADNARVDDGYRFHDVFHLACLGCLGWSPVSRRNLGLKRRSNPITDEVEDGGRAIVIEEGISALIFSYAMDNNWLMGTHRVDHDLLKLVTGMTAHLESRICTVAEWEDVIQKAYPIWKQVYDNGGGVVTVNQEQRAISYLQRG